MRILKRLLYGEEIRKKNVNEESKQQEVVEETEELEEVSYPRISTIYTIDINDNEFIDVEYILDDNDNQSEGLLDITYSTIDESQDTVIITYDTDQLVNHLLPRLEESYRLTEGVEYKLYNEIDELAYDYTERITKERDEEDDLEKVIVLLGESEGDEVGIILNTEIEKALIKVLQNIKKILD